VLTEHGSARGDVLLDWNESPLGPPPAAVRRVVDVAQRLHRYPRGLMEEVTTLAADHLRVSPAQVLLTSGVDEAVDITLGLAARAWGVRPGFDGYEDRVRAAGKAFHGIPLGSSWQPADGWEAIGDEDIVFLAQPGNPTGNLLDPDWVDQVRRLGPYVFVDETYQEFSSRGSVLDEGVDDPRLLVYRSFSKAMGLAGIRIGCLVATEEVVSRLEPARRFMPIDAVSLSAAAGVLEDLSFVKLLTAHVREARPALAATLQASGLFDEVRDTEANFVVARPRPGMSPLVDRALSSARIRVKHCDVLGLPGWIRVSVGSWDDQRRLGECLASVTLG
jgi:histidinol-phosphate/aromatic aminotransferase/cobyric acid decarboxylase-like protein